MNTPVSQPRQSIPRPTLGDRRKSLTRTDSPQSVAHFDAVAPPTAPLDLAAEDCYTNRALHRRTSGSKRVRFYKMVAARLTKSHRDYTPQQIHACWYQDYELRDIQNQCEDDFRHLSSSLSDKYKLAIEGSGQHDTDRCLRGLECYDDVAYTEKKVLRDEAASCVLGGQEEGLHEEFIAQEYGHVASPSQMRANIVGVIDQRVAEAVYGEDEKIEEAKALQKWRDAKRGLSIHQRTSNRSLSL